VICIESVTEVTQKTSRSTNVLMRGLRGAMKHMLGMANAWLTLAEQHLKNSETVLATPRAKASDD
jgi:hypothetical protein